MNLATNKTQFSTKTLVDQVEERILDFIKNSKLRPGDNLPNETQMSENLGISRNVTREAMSRLRMLGIIQTRTKRGITIVEPPLLIGLEKVTNPYLFSESTMHHIIEMRIAIELGITDLIFDNLKGNDLDDLRKIVEQGGMYEAENWPTELEKKFHMRIYQITQNPFITQFQQIVHIVFEYAKENYDSIIKPINDRLKAEGKLITHLDLYHALKERDRNKYREAIKGHLNLYLQIKSK